ncbi:unnamed protein product [Rotaria socialis]|uniref:Polyketide synthase n=1 Tax=Rotaria socialis TaxID=392032 RepID=A0A819XNN8_9BILA|nr:unnamed protein product [Rotaria socialis]
MSSLKLNIDLSPKEDVAIQLPIIEESKSSATIVNEDLAIVGIACRFPGGSNSIDEFWSNLVGQQDCVRPVPNDRWNADFYTDSSSNELFLPAKIPSARCGWIDFVGEFDCESFSISKREAENMDPQQQLLLEVTLQALEDSGMQYAGSKTGVYVGIGQAEQYELTTADLESINPYSVTGSALSLASNRLSYCFDLRGPSMSVDTACSSSLTAFHLACQAIRDGTCSAAIVAGVNIIMNPSTFIQFSQLGVLSPDGMCQSFSNKANGYVRSEGCGVVIIKPLKQALIDNDHIYCRVRGSAINQDGHISPSLTMPSSQAQVEVFQMACKNGKVNPTEIFYAEAHATGTKVGDPTEANAIGTVFGRQESYLRIGSVKSNVGHLETASFMAGLLKCILMLEHQQLIPNIHFKKGEGNPDIKFEQYKLSVQTEIEKFQNQEELMMISSFGFGGANGCVIIQGYKRSSEQSLASSSSSPQLFLVSASTPQALEVRIQELKLSTKIFHSPTAISYTLYNRSLHRLTAFAIDEKLDENTTFTSTRKRVDQSLTCIWVFAGQGPQHPKMGKTLYANIESFRCSIDASDLIYRECSGHSLIHDIGLFGSMNGPNPMAVYDIAYTLPALVFLQIGLVDMYRHLGVPCAAVFGHSFGEMAAAYAANIFTRQHCIQTAYQRARILRQMDGRGAMLAVSCSSEHVQSLLETHEQIWIASYNSPNSITLGGIKESITSISNELSKQDIFNRILKINSAFHTPLMASIRSEALSLFKETLAGFSAPTIPYFSTVSGQWKTFDFDENYTVDGMEGPVLFDVAVRACLERFGTDAASFLEISAHPVLSSYLTENGSKYNLCTLHRQQSEIETTLKTLTNLRIYGYSPAQANISKLYSSMMPQSRIPHYSLYPFQRQYCVKEDPAHRFQRTIPRWHSLAGRPLAHPHTTFQTKLSSKSFVWIPDHRVQGPAVFPAAGYIEICMEVFNCMSLTNVHIEKALIIPSDPNIYRTVRIVLQNNNQSQVSMYSKLNEYDSGHWTEHMKASKGDSASSIQLPEWSNNLKSRCSLTVMEQKDVYGRFSSIGLDYGPYFQCIRTLHQGDKEAYAHLNISHLQKSLTNSKQSQFHIHPAILDSSFQVLLGTQRFFHAAYVPTFIKQIEWRIETNELPNDLYVYAKATNLDSRNILTGDIFVVDEQQQRLIGTIIGFEATQLGQLNQPQPLYSVCYQTVETPIITTITKSQLNILEIPTIIKQQETLFDNACSAYIAEFLASNPFDLETIEKWPIHRQRYWQWLHSTIESKTILHDSIELIDHHQSEALHYEAQAIHRVGKNLHLLLSDTFAVQNLFFGDNDSFMADLYSKSMTFQPYTHILAQKLVDQFKMIQEQQPTESSRVFSILELGAGTGALTAVILEKLYQQTSIIQENRLIYVFTDVSGKFLLDAKKRFSTIYPCIQYQSCNIDVDLSTQKLNMYSFDVVCAFDVLHVAQDLKLCLNRVQQLLKPNGYLLCIELTRPWTWIQFFFGLFAGWWNFSDITTRSTCFLATGKWNQLLTESGFQYVQIENEGHPEFGHSLLTARSPDWTTTIRTLSSNIIIFDTTEASLTNFNSYMEQLLELAQSLLTVAEPATVFVITLITTPPIGAMFTGFTRVWANEATQHAICSIEFDYLELQEKQMWLNRIQTMVENTSEREFIIRQRKITVPRHIRRILRNTITTAITTTDQEAYVCSSQYQKQPFRLEIDTIGQLQTLKYCTFHPCSSSLSPDDVQVEVHASALNFKDLMLALGMLENPMGFDSETLKYRENSVNLGLEFSGIVTGLGSMASHTFNIGDPVFGFANHCFSSQIITHQHFVVKKPSHLSHTDAVSLPIVFATVYAGLIVKAQLKRGETVLIHSAAGGIGQAAIQLSQYIGANVICTVGSNEKREFLKKTYGCTQFANSHSTEEWKSDVQKLTNGQGADVVLNSLKGDAIKAGLECLKTGGRFIEIGKVDMLNHSILDMNLLLRDLSFLSVQLDILMQSQTDKIQQYLQAVMKLASEKQISPIVDCIYELKDTELAFRFLMSGQHKGKLILNMQSKPSSIHPSSTIYNPTVCYILSGGTGALGLQLIQHMSAKGARKFILLSRQGTASLRPSDAAMLARLERFDIKIYIGKANVAKLEDIHRVLQEAQEKLFISSSKYSILHLAMILDDASISKLNIHRIQNVIQCKVQGAINLLQAIPNDKLENVIFFSSAASTFGNPSQANYSAANTFLDVYAGQLSSLLRKKIRVLNLGLVEDVGILAEDWKLKQILTAKGFAGGLTSLGVAELVDHVFLNDDIDHQLLYGNFQMEDLIRSYPMLKTRLEHLIDYTILNNNGSSGISSNGNEVTVQSVSAYISTLLATSNLDATESLTVQGLDSLLAVELSAGLKKQFGLVISQLALLGGLSVKQIVESASA